MKKQKTIILLSSVALLGMLGGCSPKTDSSSPSISSSQVSKIEINGANTLEVGGSTKLVANTEVSWESSDNSIATISSSGLVTAISAGEVTFTATSLSNPSLKGSHTIVISEKLPTKDHLKLSFVGNGITYSEENKTYSIPLGLDVTIKVYTDKGYKAPTVSFNVSFLDASQSTSIVTLEKIDDLSSTLIGNGVVSDATITANCSFDSDPNHNVQLSLNFEIVDLNKDKKDELFKKLESVNVNEQNKLTKASISLKKEDESDTKEAVSNYQYSLFKDATYASLTEDGETSNYYSGKKDNKYYLFTYDNDKNVQNILSSNNISEENPYSLEANSLFNIYNASPVYLLSGMIETLFDASYSLGGDFVNFGDTDAYGNSSFKISDSSILVESSFKNSESNYCNLSLNVSFEDGLINNFSFREEIISPNALVLGYYDLRSENLTYGDKVEDNLTNNPSYLSFDKYYFSKLELLCLSGTKKENVYDYTDSNKFGGIGNEYNSLTNTYSLPIYKSLPLKIDDALGNCGIDEVKVEANNTQIDVPTLTNDGILLFSAKTIRVKQDDDTYKSEVQEGETTFTLTSSKNNVSCSVTVKFTKLNLTSIEITDNKPANNDFGDVYKDEYSSYFSLKAEPSDDASEYDYEVVDESNNLIDDLSVYQYQDGNLDGISSFSYSIIGTKVGSYRFKLRAKGTNITTSDVFTINILEPLSKQTLIDNLVGKKYVKNGSTTKESCEFVSENVMRLTYTNTITSESSSADVAIEFKDGGVYIKEVEDIGDNYKGQKFKDFEYTRICGGKIKLGKGYSSVSFFATKDNQSLYRLDFTEDQSSSVDYTKLDTYLNGKTYSLTTFMGLKVDTSLTFTSNTGHLIVKQFSDKTTIIDIEFIYTYSYSVYPLFVVNSSNTSTVNSLYKYSVTDINVKQDDNLIDVKIKNENDLAYTFEYDLTAFDK